MNILIVDDSQLYRDSFTKMLSEYGNVNSCKDGIEALREFHLAHARKEPFDLISLDINMKPLDGIEILSNIREWENTSKTEKQAKIVVISSQGDIKNIMKLYGIGCQVFLKKPVEEKEMREGLKKLNIEKTPTIDLDF